MYDADDTCVILCVYVNTLHAPHKSTNVICRFGGSCTKACVKLLHLTSFGPGLFLKVGYKMR